MVLLDIVPTEYSDHTVLIFFVSGVVMLLLVLASFFLGGLFSEHKELVVEHRTHYDSRKLQREQHIALWENHLRNEVIQVNNKKELDEFKAEVFEKFDSLEKLWLKDRQSNIAINSAAMDILFKIEKVIDK